MADHLQLGPSREVKRPLLRVEFYSTESLRRTPAKQWGFRTRNRRNGRIITRSSETYANRRDALEQIPEAHPGLPVYEARQGFAGAQVLTELDVAAELASG